MFPPTDKPPDADYVMLSRQVAKKCENLTLGRLGIQRIGTPLQQEGVEKLSATSAPELNTEERLRGKLSQPAVFSRTTYLETKDHAGGMRLQPDYYSIQRHLLKMAAVRGKTLVHGTAIRVETENGPRGVLFLGGQGVGKTETAMHAVDSGCLHLEDDVVKLSKTGNTPYIGGSGYKALLRFKNRITPQMRAAPENFFIDVRNRKEPARWSHLPVKKLKDAGAILRDFKDLSEIYNGEPVPLDTIVFLVPSVTDPWQQELHNMKLKPNTNLAELVSLMAKEEWNKLLPNERKKRMARFFQSAGKINLEQDGQQLATAATGSEHERDARELVIRWLEHSAENDYHANPSSVRSIIEKTPNILLIGKWVPPEKDQAFAQMIKRFVEKNNGNE